ncbi:MAG: nodulation protein NfeD [Armatimonadota bacterium]|nr:nodulation protein NfeD [Armatimonadota bacterium]
MPKTFASFAPILAIILLSLSAMAASAPTVDIIRVEGPIGPAIAQYIHRAIEIAEQDNAQALIIKLETPGGLDDSMRAIVKDFFNSRVPIVVYVWPQGARAASAGAIITLASHIAAMSPGTAIGAAHPVNIGGEQVDKTMATKIENDAAAYARSIAKRRGRNVEWAEMIVRKSISSTEEEAIKKNVIDIIAKDMRDLLNQLDGRKVKTADGMHTINTKGATLKEIAPSIREKFLHIISNPNVAYILMLIAIYGIIFELNNPGSIFPGVIGGIALLLALYSFAILPINLTGILLIAFGIILFVTDLFVPGHGILTVGGIIAFIIGSLILFETRTPAMRISMTLVITMTILTAGFFLFALGAGARAQKLKVVTGAEGLVGQVVEARTDLNPKGKVFIEGEYWNAIAEGDPVKKGERVRIVAVDKLTLKVRKES